MNFNAKQLKEMSDLVKSGALFAIRNAKDGDAESVLKISDIITVLFANHFDIKTDKFILSSACFSPVYYSVLSLLGYNIPYLKDFKQIGGLPAHPEKYLDGVDITTGNIAHGAVYALGIAWAEKLKNKKSKIFCLINNDDVKSGLFYETIINQEKLHLDNLIYIWISDECCDFKFNNMIECKYSNLEELDNIFSKIKTLPSVIIKINTKLKKIDLSDSNIIKLEQKFASNIGLELWTNIAKQNKKSLIKNNKIFNIKIPKFKNEIISTGTIAIKYLELLTKENKNIVISDCLNLIKLKEKLRQTSLVNFENQFMAGAGFTNGIVSQNMKGIFVSNLINFDNIKSFIRNASISKIPVIYLFFNDGLGASEEGSLFIPNEQIASLRHIPNLNVFRPCNSDELEFCFNYALNETNTPSCILVSRQKTKHFTTYNKNNMSKGGYIFYDSKKPKITLLATGSEVSISVIIANKLKNVRVVSMPSVELFRKNEILYKTNILSGKVISIEAGATSSWYEFADASIGFDRFGFTCNSDKLYDNLGFSIDFLLEELKKYV